MLSQSERLDDDALIETARSKSQAHLMAISTRKSLSGAVTDVLILRGDDDVVQSTVNNPGAEFTERGFSRLVARAEGDDNLATCIGMRPSIPRHHYLKLIAKASATVKARLEAANPPLAGDVSAAVREATRRARSAPSAITRDTVIAHALVKSLYEDGRLDEHQVSSFAEAGKFDETNAAIAALANVPIVIAETMMVEFAFRGRADPGQGVGDVVVDGESHHQHARRPVGHRPRQSRSRPADLRTAAHLDRAAGAALPPHAADRGDGGVTRPVARMEQAKSGFSYATQQPPDFAALHPGYLLEPGLSQPTSPHLA